MVYDSYEVLLIHPPFHKRTGSGCVLPLGLAYVAAMLRNIGITVRVIDAAVAYDSLNWKKLRYYSDWACFRKLFTIPLNKGGRGLLRKPGSKDNPLTLPRSGIPRIGTFDKGEVSTNFRGNLKHAQIAKELSQAIIDSELNISWQIELRCDTVRKLSGDSIKLMAQSGCRQINMGFEKGTNDGLALLNKAETVDDGIAAVRNIRENSHDIHISGTFIIGGPEETEEIARQTIAFACELGLDYAHFNPLELYPSTSFFKEAQDAGKIPENWQDLLIHGNSPLPGELLYESPQMSSQRIMELVVEGYKKFYWRYPWVVRYIYRYKQLPIQQLSWHWNRFRDIC